MDSTIIPIWFLIAVFLAAAIAGGLASWLFIWRKATSSHFALAMLLATTSFTHLANGLGLLNSQYWLFWSRIALAAELLQPAALFYVGIQFLNPAAPGPASRLWSTRVVAVIGLVLALLTMTDSVLGRRMLDDGVSASVLSPWGHVAYIFIVLAMTLALAQLELVLRAGSEPVRYRLKFIAIGLGGLAAYQVYQASQMLLLSVRQPHHVFVSSIATTISLSLIAHGLVRNRLRELLVNAYVSQQALFGSVTFIAIGLYLLAVGAIGQWLRLIDEPLGTDASFVIMFAALVALAVAVSSKTVRAEIRLFLTRNFYRSKYDYRAQWIQVTEAFQLAATKESILDHLVDLLIKTFSTTTIAIWMFRDADRRFFQVRPVSGENEPLDLSHAVITKLLKEDEPIMIRDTGAGVMANDPLVRSRAELCFPIRAQNRLVGFIVLGKQLHSEEYGTDDCDLLRGICHHVGALLSNATLAEERQASAELEALHRFSVFCLHDLKNLAARLSLVAQNAELHGHDPAFQASAMRTVADTAKKMTSLMTKLSLRSFQPTLAGQFDLVEIPTLVEEVIAPFREKGIARLQVTSGQIQPIMVVREQIQQVLLNVVLNAKQAISKDGDISIAVEQSKQSVLIRVKDSGIGIPSDTLDTLFRPLQSSRPGGLGVGLYQCKRIVEAHGGTIQIRSQVGKGTEVQVQLPLVRDSEEGGIIIHTAMSS